MNNPPKSSPEFPAKEQPGEQERAAIARRLRDLALYLARYLEGLDDEKLLLEESATLIETLGHSHGYHPGRHFDRDCLACQIEAIEQDWTPPPPERP